MKERKKIWGTTDCYGCSLCSTVCHPNIIHIIQNKNGFYEPKVESPEKCTNCGFCYDVCAFHHDKCAMLDSEIHCWAAWSNDVEIRRMCSSGGVGYEIGRYLLGCGYKAVVCRYNITQQRAEHYIATTVDEFLESIGSKYIQSFTEDTFKKIQRKNEKYFVTGTPCQIDSFRRMIRKFRCEENFILLDFFCHGVPSKLMWNKYIDSVRKRIGTIKSVAWRDKTYGWHDSWNMSFVGSLKNLSSRWTRHDMFYDLFLGNVCLGPQCYDSCKYKYDKSSADIRIGDLWGNEYKEIQEGVSSVITFTEKGEEIIKHCNCTLVEHTMKIVGEGQIHEPVVRSPQYELVMQELKDPKTTIEDVYIAMIRDQKKRKIIRLLSNPIETIKRVLR